MFRFLSWVSAVYSLFRFWCCCRASRSQLCRLWQIYDKQPPDLNLSRVNPEDLSLYLQQIFASLETVCELSHVTFVSSYGGYALLVISHRRILMQESCASNLHRLASVPATISNHLSIWSTGDLSIAVSCCSFQSAAACCSRRSETTKLGPDLNMSFGLWTWTQPSNRASWICFGPLSLISLRPFCCYNNTISGPPPFSSRPRSILIFPFLTSPSVYRRRHKTFLGRGLLSKRVLNLLLGLVKSSSMATCSRSFFDTIIYCTPLCVDLGGLLSSWRCCVVPLRLVKDNARFFTWAKRVLTNLLFKPILLIPRYRKLNGRGHQLSGTSTSVSRSLDSIFLCLAFGLLQILVYPTANLSSPRLSDLGGPWRPSVSTRKKSSIPMKLLCVSSFVSCCAIALMLCRISIRISFYISVAGRHLAGVGKPSVGFQRLYLSHRHEFMVILAASTTGIIVTVLVLLELPFSSLGERSLSSSSSDSDRIFPPLFSVMEIVFERSVAFMDIRAITFVHLPILAIELALVKELLVTFYDCNRLSFILNALCFLCVPISDSLATSFRRFWILVIFG